MTSRPEHEQLISARRILNLRDDADRAEIVAHIARLRAETEAAIAASRPSIQPGLRAALDECQADYDDERLHGWSVGNPTPEGTWRHTPRFPLFGSTESPIQSTAPVVAAHRSNGSTVTVASVVSSLATIY